MSYILRKLKIEEDKDTLVPCGYGTEAETLNIYDWETDTIKRDVKLKDVSEGWQVIVTGPFESNYLRTSKISRIISRSSKRLVFKTQTSIYELIKNDE